MIGVIRKSRLSQWAIAAVALPLATMPLSAQLDMMTVEFCSSDGAVRSMSIPIEPESDEDHCVNPCHACLSRKKAPKS